MSEIKAQRMAAREGRGRVAAEKKRSGKTERRGPQLRHRFFFAAYPLSTNFEKCSFSERPLRKKTHAFCRRRRGRAFVALQGEGGFVRLARAHVRKKEEKTMFLRRKEKKIMWL